MVGFLAGEDLSPNRIELARRQAAAGAGYIDLTSSNPTHQGLLFPPDVLRAAAERYWAARRYDPDPRGLPAARATVARYYAGRTPPLPVTPEDIFITASTSEAYSLLFALLAGPGDNVLAPAVSYPLFDYLAAAHALELRPYALDEGRGWRIDPASLRLQADERTRAVLVISPHNPTGVTVHAALPSLAALGLPVICDEVFAEFPYAAPAAPPLGALHPELPVFHLNGISKMFALPDLKLGWIALSGPARERYAERLEVLNDTFLGASTLIQTMLPELFAHGGPFVDTMRARVRASLDMALAILGRSGRVRARAPDGGYYLFPAVEGWHDEEELALHLLSRGVLVHPGYFYGYERGTHIMISCLTEPARLRAGLERLVEAVEETADRERIADSG
ncbi:MAG TPA: pyridoxal phosphate-dependent aminotransferase [Roseiflexaceae bacterium]|nr:pyridoxal phosphate-dependent aminotransferase [Roseiflexaceae bacterium]